ncbi:MAG: YihY/virulence factor BrkB family protein [Chitinophagia bacterium]
MHLLKQIKSAFLTLIKPLFLFLKRKTKVIYIPGFERVNLYQVIKFLFKQLNTLGLYDRASAISFNLIMALPAGFLFLFSIIPYFPSTFKVKKQILSVFKDISPNSSTYKFILDIINDLLSQHVGIFSFGFLLLLFYASNAMTGIIRSFDKSIMQNKPFFLHQRMRAIRLTIILILLVFASLLVLIGQDQLTTLLREVFDIKRKTIVPYWNSVRWGVIILLLFFGNAFIYKYAPLIKEKWSLMSPGALLSTLLMLLTTLGFSYWVNHFSSYNKIYGSIGTVLVVMTLVYINALILLIGFELNVSIEVLKKEQNN